MINPALASVSHAQDFIAIAKFYLCAGRFLCVHRNWLPPTILVLTEVINELESEVSRLAQDAQPATAVAA